MSEPTEAIAEFQTVVEAQEALAWLREEGIEASIAGDVSETVNYPILGGMPLAPTRLVVAASDAERAREVLAHREQEQLQDNWEDAAESAINGWICPNCDTEVNPEEAFCPACGASRTDVRAEDDEGKA
jgi:rubrerythrin